MSHFYKLLVFIVLSTLLLRSVPTKGQLEGSITNLTDAESNRYENDIIPFRYPHDSLAKSIVSIGKSDIGTSSGGSQICAGVIIGPRYILTAAHCLALSIFEMGVVAGTPQGLERTPISRVLKVAKLIIHVGYNSSGHKENDIGLIEVAEDIIEDGISTQRIPMAALHVPYLSATCTVVGWGTQLFNESLPCKVLRADVNIWSQDKCKEAISNWEPGMMCVSSQNDTCVGDSGGPLICNGEVVGINSFGFEGGVTDGLLSIYTNVSHFRDWIERNLSSTCDPQEVSLASSNEASGERDEHYTHLVRGGYRPPQHTFVKHIVSIRTASFEKYFGDNHYCSGVIIAPRYILTAAHCVLSPSDMRVVAGTPQRLNKTSKTRVIQISKTMRHPRFNVKGHVENDIGLLKLEEDILEDGITTQRIKLMRKGPKPGATCTVVGWGKLLYNGPLADDALYYNLKIWSQEYCSANVYDWEPGMMCGGDSTYVQNGACLGDSGGPLICNHEVAGIVSASCGFNNAVGALSIYTNVSHYRDMAEFLAKLASGITKTKLMGIV